MKKVDVEKAYQAGIISFEQACQMFNMCAEVAEETTAEVAEEPKKSPAPKGKSRKTRKSRRQKPTPEVKTSETEKAYHTPKKNTLTAYQVKRLDGAVAKLRAEGFEKAEWRVEGKWAWIYAFASDGTGYSPAFKAAVQKAFKGTKWAYSSKRGAVVYKDFLK